MPASLNEAFNGPTSSSYRQQHNVPQAVRYSQVEPSPEWATADSVNTRPQQLPRPATAYPHRGYNTVETPYTENNQMGGSPMPNSPIYEPRSNAPPPHGSYVSAYGNIPSQKLYPPIQEPFGSKPHMWGPPSIAYPGAISMPRPDECNNNMHHIMTCRHCRKMLKELLRERKTGNSIADSLPFNDFSVSIQTLILALALIVLVHRIMKN